MIMKEESIVLCDTCLSSPGIIFCSADLAYLCATCDAVIHSANPLAGRHHRVPVTSISGFLSQESKNAMGNEDEEASWLLFDDLDQCGDLQFDYNEYMTAIYGGGDGDRIVPVQAGEATMNQNHQFHFDHHGFHHRKVESVMEYESSNGGYGRRSIQTPVPEDRKARVLRYKEKKKRRKFEKTTRYASRKAYAEIRPRIKGRFAKRTNVGADVEQILSTSLRSTTEGLYCIVPSL
ncbi:hypothetical protein LXL04_006447 [Taraxacum kok-saghyz]